MGKDQHGARAWPVRRTRFFLKMIFCRRGQRLYAKVPHGHWKTTTFVAALRHDGITAPFVLDGPINGECFLAYVKEVLAPTLPPGDIVLIDNLASHKSPKKAEGAELRFLRATRPT